VVRITLGGGGGSGKTSLSYLLPEAFLGYDLFSVGRCLTRPLADRFGMDIDAFYKKYSAPDARIDVDGKTWHLDDYLDSMQRQWMIDHPNSVIDSRVGWYFAPHQGTFSVLLQVSDDVAAQRVFYARRHEEAYSSANDALQRLAARRENEIGTYKEKYGIENYLDPAHYDFAINTDRLTHGEVSMEIRHEMRRRNILPYGID
jgi:cytidylate kinase